MKKSVIIISVIVSAIFVFLANVFLISTLKIGISQKNAPETYLTASQSPNGKYRLEAYRTEPGATVDFSIRVYMVKGNIKELVYSEAEILSRQN